MRTFLEHVANDIISKYGTDLSHIAVVFPNKRASLFLNDYLARMAGKPVWSPAYITISDLFRRHSELKVADTIKLVCDLYQCFIAQTGIDETLDHFYGWGQVLLADFDDIDKNMAEPDKVFANVRDIHELDGTDYLTDEQKAAIRKFFSNFSDNHNTLLKERFLKLWSKISDIYHAFNRRLEEQGLAYEGALYRKVVTTAEETEYEYEHYLFVGFNLLQEVEQRLFTCLKKQGKARFYWDFDRYYMSGNEAGHYISLYQSMFPNELDTADDDIYNQFATPKQISYIAATTENIQARYISKWLEREDRVSDGRRTAVVLCNEALLPTVIHSLPETVQKVNITTGYPLSQSPVASFVRQLVNLQVSGYVPSRDQFRLYHVKRVLQHPYTAFVSTCVSEQCEVLQQKHLYYPTRQDLCVDDGTRLLFDTKIDNNADLLDWLCRVLQTIASKANHDDPLFQESVFRTYGLLNRVRSLVVSGDLHVDVVTLQRLITQLITTTSIPFHGEPAEGLQVMGVLETRNLDFDHVLLLSTGEGNMPRGINDTSFIPYNIRKAYGLTTIDHKVSIYSYYFHRLLQRASDITIVYNNATTDGQTGEMSRFMLQMMVESPHHITFNTLQAGQQLHTTVIKPIEKTSEVTRRLIRRFSVDCHPSDANKNLPLLTPTGINRYLRCPLQFYYYYVCNLREPDTTEDDSIDNRMFGNIFHEASRLVYLQLMNSNGRIVASEIERMLHKRVDIERSVDEAIQKELFHSSACYTLNGLQIINREVIIHYLRLLLSQDLKITPFSIIGLECDLYEPIQIICGNTVFSSLIGGRIDRLDCINETSPEGVVTERIRVVDYKTGSRRPVPLASVEAIFEQESLNKHSDYYLQTFLYSCQVRRSQKYNPNKMPVSPALLFIQHSNLDPVLYFGKERINDVNETSRTFSQLLENIIAEIFNPSIPFVPTNDRNRCQRCPYKAICGI